jgi:hypothetical protein
MRYLDLRSHPGKHGKRHDPKNPREVAFTREKDSFRMDSVLHMFSLFLWLKITKDGWKINAWQRQRRNHQLFFSCFLTISLNSSSLLVLDASRKRLAEMLSQSTATPS